MKKSRKQNPRNRPATWADVERAKRDASNEALSLAMAIFLTVLVDKFNGEEYIADVWAAVNKLSQEISEGRVNLWDLKTVLEEEYSIELGGVK